MNLRERDTIRQALELLGQGQLDVRVSGAGQPYLARTEAQVGQVRFLLTQLLQQPEEDPMPPGWNRPAPASGDDLAAVLQDVLRLVETDDSAEGFVEWSMAGPDGPCPTCEGSGVGRITGRGEAGGVVGDPCDDCGGTGEHWSDPQLKGAEFGLRARWRIGTSMGQGGMRTFVPEGSR